MTDVFFGVLKKIEKPRPYESDYTPQMIIYSNGIISNEDRGHSWWDYYYIIPDVTLHEVYLLVNIYKKFEKKYKETKDRENGSFETHPVYFKENEIKLSSSIFETITIRKENQFVTISIVGGN